MNFTTGGCENYWFHPHVGGDELRSSNPYPVSIYSTLSSALVYAFVVQIYCAYSSFAAFHSPRHGPNHVVVAVGAISLVQCPE